MKLYKSLAIFKKDPTDDPKKPTHDVTASLQNPDGTYEKSINVGSAWTKDGQKGKYLSVGLSKSRTWEGKTLSGYVLVNEDELNKVLKLAEAMQQKLNSPLGDSYPTEVEPDVPVVSNINPEDFDF